MGSEHVVRIKDTTVDDKVESLCMGEEYDTSEEGNQRKREGNTEQL